MYDPDVCGDVDLNEPFSEAFEGAAPPPDGLRCELRLPVAQRRFAIRASGRQLQVLVRRVSPLFDLSMHILTASGRTFPRPQRRWAPSSRRPPKGS